MECTDEILFMRAVIELFYCPGSSHRFKYNTSMNAIIFKQRTHRQHSVISCPYNKMRRFFQRDQFKVITEENVSTFTPPV